MSIATYIPIESQTIQTTTSSVQFSSIPQNYSQLVLHANLRSTGAEAHTDLHMTFNGDTATNYSGTGLWGNGTIASGSRESSASYIKAGYWISLANEPSGIFTPLVLNFMNYSSSSSYKFILSDTKSVTLPNAGIKMWRSTSPITSMNIVMQYGNILAGSTLTLYGIV